MLLTVVVPVRNDSTLLHACLRGIRGCDGPRAEIIVVDDASAAAYATEIAAVSAAFDCRLVVLERHLGPSGARNHGFRAATGDIIVFLDSDVVPHADCLRRIHDAFAAEPGLAAIMGSYDSEPADPGLVSQYRNLLHSYIHHSSGGRMETFWTGCGAIRREVLESAGGFNEVYNRPSIEDVEFGVRLAADGQRIVLDPSIEVCHLKTWTLRTMVETDFLYRALPWTVLAWSGAGLPKNLNFTVPRRLSVAASFCSALLLPAALLYPVLFQFAVASFLLMVLLNVDFWGWLCHRKGMAFTGVAVGLHWVHCLTGAVGFVAGSSIAWKTFAVAKLRGAEVRDIT